MTIQLPKKIQRVCVLEAVEGKSFYDPHLPNALRKAQEYAGENGFVASLPELIQARLTSPFIDEIWSSKFTAYSEEDIGRTRHGTPVVIVVHGGGIFSSPERIERVYQDGLMFFRNRGGKLKREEVENLAEGILADGTRIPYYSFSDFTRGVPDLSRHYAVVLDYDRVKDTGITPKSKEGSLVIARAGGIEQVADYINRAEDYIASRRTKFDSFGEYPISATDPDRPEGYMLGLGCANKGLGLCDLSFSSHGNFVAVSPRTLREKVFGLFN